MPVDRRKPNYAWKRAMARGFITPIADYGLNLATVSKELSNAMKSFGRAVVGFVCGYLLAKPLMVDRALVDFRLEPLAFRRCRLDWALRRDFFERVMSYRAEFRGEGFLKEDWRLPSAVQQYWNVAANDLSCLPRGDIRAFKAEQNRMHCTAWKAISQKTPGERGMARLFRNRRRMLQDADDSPALLAALGEHPLDEINARDRWIWCTAEASEKGVRPIPEVFMVSKGHGNAQPLLPPALLPGPENISKRGSPIPEIALNWYLYDWPRILKSARALKRSSTNKLLGMVRKVLALTNDEFCRLARKYLYESVYNLRRYIHAAMSPDERADRAAEGVGAGYSSPSSEKSRDEDVAD